MDETDTLSSRYDMIIGRDLLEEFPVQKNTSWSATTPMLDLAVCNNDLIDDLEHEFLYIYP